MPLYKVVHINPTTAIYLWKITETFEDLFDEVQLNDINLIRLKTMKSELHQRGFLSVRKLLQEVGYTDFDLIYDKTGKPFLKDALRQAQGDRHISISHSHEFSAIVLSDENIGIDLELVKEKVLRIAPRFMDVSHLEGLSETDQMRKATVVWGIKEAIFKVKNEMGISFPDHITESPFLLTDNKCTAELNFDDIHHQYNITFEEIENYMLVCAIEKQNV